jgi:Tfp pilus assembly protein PilX|tara:strand:+ start:81 stop:482 length:402 start_codon:yes stop_codon:yes gene_type:complete
VSRRGRGERGSGLVAGIVILFSMTFLGLVWLARDVDRGISNRSTAHSVAFQAARSGAQVAFATPLRQGAEPTIDVAGAVAAGTDTANRLLERYDVTGTTQISVDAATVTAIVVIIDRGVTVTGQATVESRRAP